MEYEVVIGLEVHAQLLTESKMFCACPNASNAAPNQNTCPVCTGQPGALPVINQKAVELGVRAGLAMNCEIHSESVFARKHYFYPDLPKGYQISQYELPYCTKGALEISLKSGETKTIGLTRIHFEEDAGKSVHGVSGTLVNLNRAGVPLIEIVSEPDMRTSEEAGQYLRTLRSILKYAEVCDGNLEEGNFRCDANISLHPKGATEFGTKVELKNINSFRYVEKAIEFEIERQARLLDKGEKIVQETRGWNSVKNTTESMRLKEEAQDYRYFPEPDLPTLMISDALKKKVEENLPELPKAKRARFESEYGLSAYDAGVLVASKELADYFESVQKEVKNPKTSANWVINELLGKLNALGKEIENSPVSSQRLAELILLIEKGTISGRIAKTVFEEMFETGKAPTDIVQAKGLTQVSDTKALEAAARKIIAANADQAAQYRAGKTKLLGFFVGQVMKETKGQANPGVLNAILEKLLKEE